MSTPVSIDNLVDEISEQAEKRRRERSPSESSDENDKKNRKRERRRRHSRSRSRRHRSRTRSRSRSRSRSSRRRKHRRKKRSKSRSRDRYHRKSSRRRSSRRRSKEQPVARPLDPAEKLEQERKRELMELTRDHRTVFVGQLTHKIREKEVDKYFSKFGPVESVLLLKDRFTNRSKGIAYVEMTNLDDVPKVLAQNSQVPDFQSFPLMIKTSEAEKNFVAKKETEAQSLKYVDLKRSDVDVTACRVCVSNLHPKISKDDLRVVFQSFGEIMQVDIAIGTNGESKGYGTIDFATKEDARMALTKGDGLDLAGKLLKLTAASKTRGGINNDSNLSDNTYANDSWKLDDDEGIGMQMTSHSRTALMRKLAGGSAAEFLDQSSKPIVKPAPVSAPVVATAPTMDYLPSRSDVGPIQGSESFCFVMKNMFDPKTETGNEWHIEIKEDVDTECSKYGTILHSVVDKLNSGGLVYILYNSVSSACKAAHAMHGRWFGKRQVTVRFMASQEYVGMFPEARSHVQQAQINNA